MSIPVALIVLIAFSIALYFVITYFSATSVWSNDDLRNYLIEKQGIRSFWKCYLWMLKP